MNFGLVWFDLVVYQVSTFYYVWIWSKSLLWCGGWMKANSVFIFGPNLKTKTLLRPRPKQNKITTLSQNYKNDFFLTHPAFMIMMNYLLQ